MRIKSQDPKKLVPYENNARTHPQSQIDFLIKSITEFGFKMPILVDENNMVISGHGRRLAALQMGLDKVPTIADGSLSEDQKRAFIIADNKSSEMGGWDDDILNFELSQISGSEYDVGMTGFDYTSEEFIPTTEPNAGGRIITEQDMIKAKSLQDNLIENIPPIPVMCPNCGAEFSTR